MRQLARKSALNARARENAIVVIDQFTYDAPKTSLLASLVSRLGYEEKKVLILTAGLKENVFLSGRNLPNVHVMPYSDVSTYHVLWSDVVLIESEALGEKLDTIEESAEVKAAAKKSAAKAEAKPAKPAAKKAAAKKTAKVEAKAKTKKPAAKKAAATKPAKKKGK
jgi:hypothetical protein